MPPASFIHSQAWQQVQEAFGRPCLRVEDQLFIRYSLPRQYWYYLSSRCHVTTGVLSEVTKVSRGCLFLRLEPVDPESLTALQTFAHSQHLQLHPRPSVQPRQSLLLNLEKTEEELLADMKQKHRYNIRVAQKHGVTIECVDHNLISEMDRFWRLHHDTARRQNFRTHAKAYYESIFRHMGAAHMARLLFARTIEGKDIATLLLIDDGVTTTYLHGGSSEDHKNLMAPYLLQWEAIRQAKAKGCRYYDFWGTNARYNEEKKEWQPIEGHPSYGTTRLKLGFGGDIVEYPGTYDLVLQPTIYRGYQLLQTLRHRKRAFA
jgi:lipid II:glycine glycyltransferase (peptidoglycan interpeptide bridge formation enzyme)